MKKFLKVLALILMIPLAVALPVFLAQTINEDAKVYAQTADDIQQRIEKYKTQLPEEPTKSVLDRLKLRCSVSQTALKNVQTRVEPVQEKRVNAYKEVNAALTELVTVLEEADIDVTDLKAQATVFKEKTDALVVEIDAYKQAVSDAAELDCNADPLALTAAIQEGRNRLTTIVSSVPDIREHVDNLLKPSLQKVKADLQVQQNAEQAPATDSTEVPATEQGATDATQ